MRWKPIYMIVQSRVKTSEILGFSVAKMPARGTLAQLGLQKYNWYDDERSKKFQAMLVGINHCFTPNITFKCDNNTSYNKWITNQVPNAKLEQITTGKKKAKRDDDKDFDPLFSINNTFARMRHDMNRLARKTWSTKKAIHGLENHIWLYIAWNNKYKIK